jgi:sulfonate transport system substrate-binding protein
MAYLIHRGGRRQTLPFFIICVIGVICGTFASPAQEPDLTVAVNTTTIESFPVFAAATELAKTTAAPRLRVVPVQNGRIAMAQLVGGMADAATGSETQALLNSVADPRIRIVLTLSECRYRIVARQSAGIRRVADLRGKRVAATLNTSSVFFLTEMLRHSGLQESDVRVVNVEGPAMANALKARDVDAVAIWEPHAQHSIEALGADAVVFQDGAVYTEYFNLNTRSDVLMNPMKRAALTALVRAINRASDRLRTHSAEMISTLAPNVSLPERTVSAVWPQFKFPAALAGRLESVLVEVEPWVASTQQRKPRTRRELVALIDNSLLK